MKILKVISALVAIVLTALIIWGCIAWSQSLYIGVSEPEVLVFEQIGVILLSLGVLAGIWIIAIVFWQTFD